MKKVHGFAVTFLTAFAVMSMAAYADASTDAVTSAASGLKDQLVSIGTTVLPYAAAVLALTLGWRFAKKFVKG